MAQPFEGAQTATHGLPARLLRAARLQISQVRKEGIPTLLKKLKTVPALFLFLPFAVLARLLRPWLLVRFAPLPGHRIGHFAASAELYLCERSLGMNQPKRRHLDVFYYVERPLSNAQLHRMLSRVMHIVPRDLSFLERLIRLLPRAEAHVIPFREDGRDAQGLMATTPAHLSFLAKEQAKGRRLLREMNVPEGADYICFYERDPAYLKMVFPNWNWGYHDYRDGNIRNYLPAAIALAERRYYALRMGAVVTEKLPTQDARIIDYAARHRSEFMDVFLCANCRFFLGNPAGLVNISFAFRRPCAMVNVVPLEYVPAWGPNDLFIPKKYRLLSERRFMTFREILESGAGRFLRAEQFAGKGIEIVENAPEEITALAIEMDERLKGTWRTTEEDEDLQRRFRALFKSSPLNGVFHARIGRDFLRQHADLLR